MQKTKPQKSSDPICVRQQLATWLFVIIYVLKARSNYSLYLVVVFKNLTQQMILHSIIMNYVRNLQLRPCYQVSLKENWRWIVQALISKNYRRNQVRHHVTSPKPGIEGTLGSLAVANLVKYTAFFAFFLEILVEKKLESRLVWTTGNIFLTRLSDPLKVVVMLRIAWSF